MTRIPRLERTRGAPERPTLSLRAGSEQAQQARLRWLLSFLCQNLSSLTVSQWYRVDGKFLEFCRVWGSSTARRPWILCTDGTWQRFDAMRPKINKFEMQLMESLQMKFMEAIRELAASRREPRKERWYELPDISAHPKLRFKAGRIVSAELIGFPYLLQSQFVIEAYVLLVKYGARLRICANPTCEAPFVATKRQIYCTAKCSQTVRTRTYRAKHPEIRKLGYRA